VTSIQNDRSLRPVILWSADRNASSEVEIRFWGVVRSISGTTIEVAVASYRAEMTVWIHEQSCPEGAGAVAGCMLEPDAKALHANVEWIHAANCQRLQVALCRNPKDTI